MHRSLLLSLLFLGACRPQPEKATEKPPVVITNDTIPEMRDNVNLAPVASYSERVKDELNDWKFSVDAYETRRTFHFQLRMQYKELRVTDSVNIPNFGIRPTIEIHKGKDPLTCIVGFLDKKGLFKEYRKVSVKNEQLKINSLASYYVGSYRTTVK